MEPPSLSTLSNVTDSTPGRWEGSSDYQLPKTTTILYSPEGVKVILLGTAHISHKSVLEAQEVVRNIRPQLVFVELCKSRQHLLNLPLDRAIERQELNAHTLKQEFNSAGAMGVLQLVLSNVTWLMADKIGLEITPGTEFAAAYQEARKYQGIVALGDREIHITLKRAWRALSMWEKTLLAWILSTASFDDEDFTLEQLEKMKDSDVITEMIRELAEKFPGLVEPLIYERDRFLTYRLRQYCTKMNGFYSNASLAQNTNQDRTIVAIVGMGHVEGICKAWGKDIDGEDFQKIQTIPKPALIEQCVWYGAILLPLAGVGYLVYRRWQ
eukprot:m.96718 g.96718  ORF g.96718 m.96718 type:complete len:326 (-) comp26918_c2_seq1:44-1021(-)